MITKKEAKLLCKEIENSGDKDLYNGVIMTKAQKLYTYINATPTEEEVCKALSDELGENVLYNNGIFYGERNNMSVCQFVNRKKDIAFDIALPPHLITLVGRFYEGVIDSE
jgi:hypothetical protein